MHASSSASTCDGARAAGAMRGSAIERTINSSKRSASRTIGVLAMSQ